MDVYQYEDFRQYLKECFEARKAQDPDYSHRKLATTAGFKNPSYFLEVISGRRTLSANAAGKLVTAFGMKEGEAEYFKLLVDYGQAKKPAEKAELYRQMTFRRSRSAFVRLNPGASKYYQDWRYPLVRAAIEVFDFQGDYEALSRFIRPPLPVTAVKKCVRDLCEWELVRQRPDGCYEVTNRFQEHAPSMGEAIKRLNREWILQAADAIDQYTRDERHISSRLLTVSHEAKARIDESIQRFRQEVYDIVKDDSAPEQVMQLNLQFFPRSQKRGSERAREKRI